jgi:AraC-like DNA-binding protein
MDRGWLAARLDAGTSYEEIARELGCSPSKVSYRCALCRVEGVTDRRRRVKRILLEEAGGACVLCGYARCTAALHFHHLDPASKGFAIGVTGVTRSLEAARAEAR